MRGFFRPPAPKNISMLIDINKQSAYICSRRTDYTPNQEPPMTAVATPAVDGEKRVPGWLTAGLFRTLPVGGVASKDMEMTSYLTNAPIPFHVKTGETMNAPEAAASITTPTLAAGETYVGAIVKADGAGHHIVLLPGDNNAASWQAQMEWAKSIGGNLPSRIEQAMLFAYHHDAFKPTWYWSNEQHAANSDYAWSQTFSYGDRKYYGTNNKLRARAVRRVPI